MYYFHCMETGPNSFLAHQRALGSVTAGRRITQTVPVLGSKMTALRCLIHWAGWQARGLQCRGGRWSCFHTPQGGTLQAAMRRHKARAARVQRQANGRAKALQARREHTARLCLCSPAAKTPGVSSAPGPVPQGRGQGLCWGREGLFGVSLGMCSIDLEERFSCRLVLSVELWGHGFSHESTVISCNVTWCEVQVWGIVKMNLPLAQYCRNSVVYNSY